MRIIMISLAATAALSAIASPAAAATAQQNVALAASQDQQGGGTTESAQRARAAIRDDRIVCLRVNPGASRITRRVCRTQAEWRARGGDEIADPR